MDYVISTSGAIGAIAKALIIAQGNMGAVKKNAENPHFRSKYADLEEVVAATTPALQAAGIAVIQAPGGDGTIVTVETMFLHESGEWIRSTLGLRPAKNDPQGAGSAITYGRRYALLAMCGLAAEDDDGNAASKPPSKPERAARAVTPITTTTGMRPPRAEPSDKQRTTGSVDVSFKPAPLFIDSNGPTKQRTLAMTLFSRLGYDAEQRYDFYEQVAGYTDDGEPIRSWQAVVESGRASRVIDALQSEANKLQTAGLA